MGHTHFGVARVPPNHFQWMSDRSGVTLTADFSAVAAVDTDNDEWCRYCKTEHPAIRGMVGYSDTTPSAAYVHIVLDTPVAARTLKRVALPLLFEVADKEIALGQVRASNVRGRRLMVHLGFKLVVTLPGAFKRDDDILIYRLDRTDWRANGGKG